MTCSSSRDRFPARSTVVPRIMATSTGIGRNMSWGPLPKLDAIDQRFRGRHSVEATASIGAIVGRIHVRIKARLGEQRLSSRAGPTPEPQRAQGIAVTSDLSPQGPFLAAGDAACTTR